MGWVGGGGGGQWVVYCIFVLLPTYTIKNTTLSVKPQDRNGKNKIKKKMNKIKTL